MSFQDVINLLVLNMALIGGGFVLAKLVIFWRS